MFKKCGGDSGSRILCISRLLHQCQSKTCLPLDQVASFSTLTITVSARNKHFRENKTEQTLKFDTDARLCISNGKRQIYLTKFHIIKIIMNITNNILLT